MKSKLKLKSLTKNINLLYLLFILLIGNIIHLIYLKKTKKLIATCLIGLIIYCINQNMIVVLFFTLLISNLCLNDTYVEGLENKQAEEAEPSDNAEEEEEEEETAEDIGGGSEDNSTLNEDFSNENDHPEVEIDGPSTLQSSYDNLQKFLDSSEFNKLTEETHRLAKSQGKLMNSLQTLAPILKDTRASIGNLDLSNFNSLSNIINSIGNKKTN